MTTKQAMTVPDSSGRPKRARRFLYEGFDIDAPRGRLTCRYRLDDRPFREIVTIEGPRGWGPAAEEAARLVFLLSGVSYFKAGAPPVLDLGGTPVRNGEREFLASFYREGLEEFAFRNRLDLQLEIAGGAEAGPPAPYEAQAGQPLVPFGGGIDSIVTAELVRGLQVRPALFVVSSGDRSFAAIDDAAGRSGLPVLRARRELDPGLLQAPPGKQFNGHVPVTGILSSIAVLGAVLGGHDAVVMSNERSASAGSVVAGGRSINHQYSKSLGFENGFRRVLEGAFAAPPDYFSLLRSASALSIARRFAQLQRYHRVFRSCNRAFSIDPGARMSGWCGACDKCCFVDLMLSPFLPVEELGAIFGGQEPLRNPQMTDRFATLLGLSGRPKPFECVGDVDECRGALVLASARRDPAGEPLLAELMGRLDRADPRQVDDLLRPAGPDNIPPSYAPAADLG